MVEVKTSATVEGLEVLKTLGDIIKTEFGQQIAERILYTTKDSIETEIFLTHQGTQVTGIVDLGDYLESYEIDNSGAPDSFIVGSTDENATEIEEGRPPNSSDPKDSTVIEWVKRKKFAGRRYIRVGQRIARFIRRNGIAPKPAFQIGMERAKADNDYIVQQTVVQLTKKLNI